MKKAILGIVLFLTISVSAKAQVWHSGANGSHLWSAIQGLGQSYMDFDRWLGNKVGLGRFFDYYSKADGQRPR